MAGPRLRFATSRWDSANSGPTTTRFISHRESGRRSIESRPREEFPRANIPGYSYNVAPDGRFLLLKSEYQNKASTQLEIVENWRSLLH